MLRNLALVAIIIGLVICCIISVRNMLKKKRTEDSVQSVLLILITVLIGVGTFLTSNPDTITVMVPELSELTEENQSLKDEVDQLQKMVVDKDAEIDNKNEELKDINESIKNNAQFYDYDLYINDDKLIVNSTNSIAKIDGMLYFSEDVIENITDEKVNEDKYNKLIYIGKYPDETIDLLSVSEPFDATDNFWLGSDNSYKIQNNIYTEGFVLKSDPNTVKSVKFNLEGKYSELIFKVGHIDESDENDIILTIILDENSKEEYTFNCNSDPSIEHKIPLNKAKILTLEWYGEDFGKYGFFDVKVK